LIMTCAKAGGKVEPFLEKLSLFSGIEDNHKKKDRRRSLLKKGPGGLKSPRSVRVWKRKKGKKYSLQRANVTAGKRGEKTAGSAALQKDENTEGATV